MVYTVCHCQQSDQGLQCLPFAAVWSVSTLFSILRLISVYSICHSQQSRQGLHYLLPSKQFYQGLHYLPFSAVWSRSTLFANLSSLIKVKVYTVILRNSLFRVYTNCHSQQSDQGLHCLPFSAVWSASTLFAILSRLIRVYTVCHSQQYDHGLQYLKFSAVWSGSTLFTILCSLIRVFLRSLIKVFLRRLIKVCTVYHSQ